MHTLIGDEIVDNGNYCFFQWERITNQGEYTNGLPKFSKGTNYEQVRIYEWERITMKSNIRKENYELTIKFIWSLNHRIS